MPPERLSLEGDEIHVWRAYLNQTQPRLSELWTWLSADERERAKRFYFRRDCDRYVAARGVLRDILSRYLGTAPDQIRFSYGEHGKPALGDEAAGARLTFNLSHSREIALYAIAKSHAVGIDIEFVREDYSGDAGVAERFFSPEECSALCALPRDLRTTAFSTAGRARNLTLRRAAKVSPSPSIVLASHASPASRRGC